MPFCVKIIAVPKSQGFLARLLGGGGPTAAVIKAVETITAMRSGEIKQKLNKLPWRMSVFNTEQEAKVAVQTLNDDGIQCEIIEVN